MLKGESFFAWKNFWFEIFFLPSLNSGSWNFKCIYFTFFLPWMMTATYMYIHMHTHHVCVLYVLLSVWQHTGCGWNSVNFVKQMICWFILFAHTTYCQAVVYESLCYSAAHCTFTASRLAQRKHYGGKFSLKQLYFNSYIIHSFIPFHSFAKKLSL